MILTHTKGHINTYKLGDQEIKYNMQNKTARYKNVNGSDTKKRNLNNEPESFFVMSCFDSLQNAKQTHTLECIINHFHKSRENKVSTRTHIEEAMLLKAVRKMFGHTDFSNCTSKNARNILENANMSTDKKNRIKKKMQQVVDYAISEDIFPTNYNVFKPIKLFVVPKSEKKTKLFFELGSEVPNEHHTITRLYSVANSPHQKMMLFLLTITGARINEIQNLKWSDLVIKENSVPYLQIRNSKIKPTDTKMGEFRCMDINPTHLQTLYELKKGIEEFTPNTYHWGGAFNTPTNTTEPQDGRFCDRREEMRFKYILSGHDGYSPSYTTLRRWYADLWSDAYDKYVHHNEYPFLHERKPTGLTFHAFRRHYVCSFRDSIENFSLEHHTKLQMMIGHTVGSAVTDSIYTQFKETRVPESKLNSQIKLGVDFG